MDVYIKLIDRRPAKSYPRYMQMRGSRPPSTLLYRSFPQRICHQCITVRFRTHPSIRCSSTESGTPPSTGRSTLSEKAAEYIDTLQVRALAATQRLNDITGYSSIESLKSQIQAQDSVSRTAREAVTKAKQAYSTAVTTRAETQRELTNLLNRKTSWTPDDLARFTTLYPSDHENELQVARASEELSRAEQASEEASAELGRLILSRYHEEQIWSDKIRRASTWGTFALMGVNVMLFVLVQVGLEPWRRKRLVKGFEEKVKEAVMQLPVQQLPVQIDTISIAQEEQRVEESEEALLDDNTVVELSTQEMEDEDIESGYVPEMKDIWISAAGGAVVGGLITAVGTWLISR